eukprot:1228208-Rhodomonas_salina.3
MRSSLSGGAAVLPQQVPPSLGLSRPHSATCSGLTSGPGGALVGSFRERAQSPAEAVRPGLRVRQVLCGADEGVWCAVTRARRATPSTDKQRMVGLLLGRRRESGGWRAVPLWSPPLPAQDLPGDLRRLHTHAGSAKSGAGPAV